jgi:ABC-type sulfate/molybdate transport systems ATPase subunit
MVELDLKLERGNFNLEIDCALAAPWTVVFGPSGAGKTTLLRLIAGLDSPDSCRIAIRGKYVCDTAIGLNLQPGRRAIGMVTQQSALFPHLSVIENVGYGLLSTSPSERHNDIAFMLELVGAADLADQPVRSLSGGQAQRIALARALAPMPQLLLLDEPLSALDALARDELLSRLQRLLAENQIQTIVVTHDAADALATGAEVALLQEGKLAALGPAHTVLASERERLLARLNPE